MEKKFTRFITYRELLNYNTDLYADAFGVDALEAEVFQQAEEVCSDPDDKVVIDLFDKIRNNTKVF